MGASPDCPPSLLLLQARHGTSALALIVLSAIALELVLPKSCWSFAEANYGMAPAQLAMVVLALVDTYLMTPKVGSCRCYTRRCLQRVQGHLGGKT